MHHRRERGLSLVLLVCGVMGFSLSLIRGQTAWVLIACSVIAIALVLLRDSQINAIEDAERELVRKALEANRRDELSKWDI